MCCILLLMPGKGSQGRHSTDVPCDQIPISSQVCCAWVQQPQIILLREGTDTSQVCHGYFALPFLYVQLSCHHLGLRILRPLLESAGQGAAHIQYQRLWSSG